MKTALIGYTGFVGGHLSAQQEFEDLYNSKNINEIIGKKYDRIVCAGIRAEKFLANKYPERDLQQINNLIDVLSKVTCKHFVLISTIDVYSNPLNVDEDSLITQSNSSAYGKNRLYMEDWAKNHFDSCTVIRLPALFGTGLKKNFVYDCISKIPSMIMKEKYNEFALKDESGTLKKSYKENEDGNFVFISDTTDADKEKLREVLSKLGFTSMVFTDSRSSFPFYYLKYLSEHMQIAIDNNLEIVNLTSAPTTASEIAKEVFGIDFINENPNKAPANYDIKTKYYQLFGGENGYIFDKNQVMDDLKEYAGSKT